MSGVKRTIVIIDNSGSMADSHEGIPLINYAKVAAKAIIETLGPTDRVRNL